MADSFIPPADVAANAQRALDVRAKKPASQRGMTSIGVARAGQLANRKPVSLDTITRMVAYFDRHEVDKQGATWSEQGKGWQAWMGWGGDEGRAWARRILKENTMQATKASRRHSEGDMKLIRSARKNLMDTLNLLVELGDDGAEDMLDAAEAQPAIDDTMKRYAVKDVAVGAVLTQLLAQTVNLYYTASAAHWNVGSFDFPQYHAFFESVYEAMEEEIDTTAEFIRAQDVKAPTSLAQLVALCPDYGLSPDADIMTLLQCLADCNADMLLTIAQGIAVAGATGEYGVQNYLQDRMALSQKLAWMMRQALQGEQESIDVTAEPGEAMPGAMPTMDMAEAEMATMMAKSRKAIEDRNTTPKEREAMPEGDFVFPDTRNFPVVTPGDIDAAVSSWGRYKGPETFETFKANLIALAQRKGEEFVSHLPEEWKAEMAQTKSFDNAATMITEEMRALARQLLGGR